MIKEGWEQSKTKCTVEYKIEIEKEETDFTKKKIPYLKSLDSNNKIIIGFVETK